MSAFRFQIENRYGDLLDLSDPRYRLDNLPDVKRNYSLQPKQQQDGAVLLGDGKVIGRKLSLKFDFAGARATRVSDVYELLNILGGFFRVVDAPFYCNNLDRSVRARVFGEFSPNHSASAQFRILKDSIIPIDMLDSDWEDSTPIVSAQTALDSGETMALAPALPSYSSDVYPIIEITGTPGSPTIFSIETGRIESSVFVPFRAVALNEPEFATDDIITLDSTNGKLYFNGQERFEMLAKGYPLKFDRKNQVMRFNAQSGSGDILARITHRKRSLYG